MPTILPKPTARAWDDFSQYVPLLLDAIDAELMRDDAWEDADRDDALQYIADLKTYIVELPDLVNRRYDSEVIISPITMDVGIGNAVTANFTALTQRENVAYAQFPAIQSQSLQTVRFMAAGDWRYRITSVRTSGSGILKLTLNIPGPTVVVTIIHDLYVAGANQLNQYQTGAFTLPDDVKVFFDLGTNGKNASSSAFNIFVSLIEMWRED